MGHGSGSARPPFERLVERHGLSVLRICRSIVGIDDADDAWSQSFLQALRAYPRLPDDANHEAWLVTIAQRSSIDLLRQRRRWPMPVASNEVLDALDHRLSRLGLPDEAPDGEIWRLVAALPPRQREVIGYRYLGGLGFPAIAELIGCSPAAARRASSDGLRTLRSQLSEGERG